MAVVLVLLLAAAGTLVFFHRMFPPVIREAVEEPVSDYDSGAMLAAVDREQVDAEMSRILAVGSRFMGQRGVYDLEQIIRDRYVAAGLEVYEQENNCAVPRTLQREIFTADGQPLADVEIYPFLPNNLQPMNTPADGLSGTLLLIDEEILETRQSFADCIGLIDAREDRLPQQLGFLWSRYAKLGLKALVVSHPAGLERMPWERIAGGSECMVSTLPVNYVRLAATPNIFRHVGRKITLKVRTEYTNTRHTTLIGVMRAPRGNARSALVLSCDYDACSVLPDLAPGGLQALGPALHLAALEGLQSYRGQIQRDLVFISFGGQLMSHDGKHNLLRVLGPNAAALTENVNPVLRALGQDEKAGAARDVASPMKKYNESQAIDNENALAALEEIDQVLNTAGFFQSAAATTKQIASLGEEARALFDEQVGYVLNALILELSEPTLQSKIAFEKLNAADVDSPAFAAYQAAKAGYEQAMSVAGFSLEQIVGTKRAFLDQYHVVERWRDRFRELQEYHRLKQKHLAQDRALIDFLGAYEEKVFLHPYLAPAGGEGTVTGEELSFLAGAEGDTQPKTFNELLGWARRQRGLDEKQLVIPSYKKGHEGATSPQIRGTPNQFISAMGSSAGYSFYAPISQNRGSSYLKYAYPVVLPFMVSTASLEHSLPVLGEVMLTLAMGNRAGAFEGRAGRFNTDSANVNFGGRVLVANVGQSIVPNFPLNGALLTGARIPQFPVNAGYYDNPLYFTNPYGGYDLPLHVLGFGTMHGGGYSPVAVGYGPDGTIHFIKDEGASGQRLFKSTGISTWVTEIMRNVTIVTFRATPVTLLDLLNPQTMREYSGVELLDKQGLAPIDKICRFPTAGVREGIQTTFVSPDETVFIKLLSGTPDNEFANETRAFLLNIRDDFVPDPDRQIDGAGYRAVDHALVYDVAGDVARSMSFLNGKRLELQKQHHMADERTEAYHRKSLTLTAESESGALPFTAAARKAREAITYAILNHPILRESIFEAVLGILWYLGLLVPFVFFFEKLVFGFTDIRKQLIAQGIVFLVVFVLLNILHPAFAMVRSSVMILLGFVIMIISGGVTVMASAKFHENLEDLRKKSGKMKAADINALSAVSSAFILGLNNMHRRRVRTGLTCATLVLMTFVMICFTSVQSDLVDTQVTLGKAMYQGFLVKRDRFRTMTSGEVYALNQEYGQAHDICRRTFLVGNVDWEGFYQNPSIEAVYQTPQGVTKRTAFKSILTFNDRDPVRDGLRFKSRPTWFTETDCIKSETPPPVMIPETVADELSIRVADVEAGRAAIVIHSVAYPVKAIFEADSLDEVRDLDGRDLLPFDIDGLETVNQDQSIWQVLADEDAPRIPGRQVILFPDGQDPDSCQGPYSKKVIASTAVAMPDLAYRDAKEKIEAYLERSARSVYYGLDGIAYLGKRSRERSLVGLIDMLIPLVIAALVVLNTIRGSVYERRDEIYVYNAVGIAPRYVFFMFFAEAIVYAVVGALLGYLLSQGVGRILTELDMTGGMNMTFTSLTTIYASLAIAGATFISTFFPARTAMEIATPAEDAGWELPEPADDVLSFDLPFTFSHRDRIAVLAFFHRYLEDHGEGSSGRFFAGRPALGVSDEFDPLANQGYLPQIRIAIWLKPFDLSVSQEMIISLPTDPETKEFKAHVDLVRLSGTKESWIRLNRGFVAQVRKHFLHWRAVPEEDRAEMFTEARALMEQEAGLLAETEPRNHHG